LLVRININDLWIVRRGNQFGAFADTRKS